jgi:hypothetical protein
MPAAVVAGILVRNIAGSNSVGKVMVPNNQPATNNADHLKAAKPSRLRKALVLSLIFRSIGLDVFGQPDTNEPDHLKAAKPSRLRMALALSVIFKSIGLDELFGLRINK